MSAKLLIVSSVIPSRAHWAAFLRLSLENSSIARIHRKILRPRSPLVSIPTLRRWEMKLTQHRCIRYLPRAPDGTVGYPVVGI